MKFKRLSLMFLMVVIAISAAQAGQDKVENNPEQKRVQKKSKVAQFFQNKLWGSLRAQKQVRTQLQDETCDPQTLKGNGAGTDDCTGDQIRDQKKECITEDPQLLKTQDRLRAQKQVRTQLQDETCDPQTLKGDGAGPGDGTGDPIEDPIKDRIRDQKKECINEDPLKTQDRIQKQDRIQDGTCDPDAVLKGDGAGPGDGTGEPIDDPIKDRIRNQKKECINEDPLKTQDRIQKQDRLQDGTCDPDAVLKGDGAGPGDGTGDPIEDPIKDRIRDQKKECINEDPLKTQDRLRAQKQVRTQLQDETCDPQTLKGNGAGTDDCTGDPIRDQKKECIDEDPQLSKSLERVRKQVRTQTRVEDEDEEMTIEFLMFLKSYFAEIDAQTQRNRDRLETSIPENIGAKIRGMKRLQKGI